MFDWNVAAGAEDAMWCEIRVAGHLDASWSAWFDGLAIRHAADGDTVLAGRLADQAALHGALARVRDLGLDLRTVDCRGSAPETPPVRPDGHRASPHGQEPR